MGGQLWPYVYLPRLWGYYCKPQSSVRPMLMAKMFTAHAPCHVTCRQGVKNDHIFGYSEAILLIHHTTFMGLWWRLRADYRRKLYTRAFCGKFWSIVLDPVFDFGKSFQGLNINCDSFNPKRHTLAPCPDKKTHNLSWITLTNLNVFLPFLAHIISIIRFTKNVQNLVSNLLITM